MAAFRDAESRGLDLNHSLPALVQGRSIRSADDIAAMLHGRVTKWIKAAGAGRQSDYVVGLGPAPVGVTDPDLEQALEERRTLIEQRARSMAEKAFDDGQTVAQEIGRSPSDPVLPEDCLGLRL